MTSQTTTRRAGRSAARPSLPRRRTGSRLGAEMTLLRLVIRSRWRSAGAEGLLGGLIVCTSAYGYAATYRQPVDRRALQNSLGDNTGMAALFGRPHTLATVSGFTAWRSLGVLVVVGAVWGVLLGARLFRGEEEEGRLEAVLAGRTEQRRSAATTLLAIGALLALVWTLTTLGALIGSRADGGWPLSATLMLASVLVAPAALFIALGALASQVCLTRRSAAMAGGAVFSLLFVGRMCVAALSGTQWVGDVDPLVWLDRAAPLAGSRVGWLIAVYAVACACAAGVVVLAGRRDLGGTVPERSGREPRHTRPVRSAEDLALRVAAGGIAGWLAALVAASAVVGSLAAPVSRAASQSEDMRRMFARITGTSVSGARVFIGLSVVMLSLVLCLAAASAATSLRDEEASVRLEFLLALPLSRLRWLSGRLIAACSMLTLGGVLLGTGLWAASAAGHAGIPFRTLLATGLNLVPAAVLVLAVGTLTMALRPRWTAIVCYGLLAYGFVIELVGALVKAPRWLLDTSLLYHIALAPARSPDVRTDLVLLLMSAVGFVLAGRLFAQRDLTGA